MKGTLRALAILFLASASYSPDVRRLDEFTILVGTDEQIYIRVFQATVKIGQYSQTLLRFSPGGRVPSDADRADRLGLGAKP